MITAFAVGMRVAGVARALPVGYDFAAPPTHAAAPAAARKHRTTSTAFVDGGSI